MTAFALEKLKVFCLLNTFESELLCTHSGMRTNTLLIENFWRHQTIMLSCNPHFSCTSTNVFGNHHNWSKVRLTSTSSKYLQTHWVNLEIKVQQKEYSLSSGYNPPCTFYPPLKINQQFWTVLKLNSNWLNMSTALSSKLSALVIIHCTFWYYTLEQCEM